MWYVARHARFNRRHAPEGRLVSDTLARITPALAPACNVQRDFGAGGVDSVYLAHDAQNERDVAIKVLHPDPGAALGADRFLAGIKTTAKMQHPHILPLLDSGSAHGLLWYAMPYVEGDTLRDRLERETQLPIAEAVRLAREVADALHAAHARGLKHPDIAPENILLQGGAHRTRWLPILVAPSPCEAPAAPA